MILTASQPRIAVTAEWVDITAANSSLASVNVMIQNADDDFVDVVVGGATRPDLRASDAIPGPVRLDTGEVIEVNAADIWVRGEGTISAHLAS